MTPRLVACWDGPLYERFASVLRKTAKRFCPNWDVRLTRVPMVVNQASKLAHWISAVDDAPDGTPMLLMDSDTMILRSLDALWDQPFDVAYTARDPRWSPYPNNAGVFAVRASADTRSFLREWRAKELPLLLTSGAERKAWLAKFGAVEQAALHQMLENTSLQVAALPCLEWNCEDSSWAHFDPKVTRIVHLKGAVRKAIKGGTPSQSRRKQIAPILERWAGWNAQIQVKRAMPSWPPRVQCYTPPVTVPRPMRKPIPEVYTYGNRHQVFGDAVYTDEWQASRKKYQSSALACLRAAYDVLGTPGSMLDAGCGTGPLVTASRGRQIDAIGLDLTLTATDGPLRHADLREPVELGRTFDLVLCWEVAEHLPEASAETLCDTLVRHLTPGGLLLFTAAPPGQDGTGHIHLAPPEYWRDRLIARGLTFDAEQTSHIGVQWLTLAPKTPWYGTNLQVFRAPGEGACFTLHPLPELVLTMRTADRSPRTNYLAGTLRQLVRQGFDLQQLHLCVTRPGVDWLKHQCLGLATLPTLHVPQGRLNANQNGLAQVRAGLDTGAAWVVLLEDDLEFCADFVGSLRRWIRDADRPDRQVFRCFGFTRPPAGFKGTAYDWPLEMLRGSQAICLRRDDAADFLAWGTKHLYTWCKDTPWRNSTANPAIAFDKFVAAWATARWPKVPGVMSHPYFVKHIGDHSSIHSRGVRNDAPFAGKSWSYRSHEASL